MLRCSTENCKNSPIGQCNSCHGLLMCKKCSKNHTERHEESNVPHILEKIKVQISNSRFSELKIQIKAKMAEIITQKNKITNDSLKINNQIKSMVRSALEQLDKRIKNILNY